MSRFAHSSPGKPVTLPNYVLLFLLLSQKSWSRSWQMSPPSEHCIPHQGLLSFHHFKVSSWISYQPRRSLDTGALSLAFKHVKEHRKARELVHTSGHTWPAFSTESPGLVPRASWRPDMARQLNGSFINYECPTSEEPRHGFPLWNHSCVIISESFTHSLLGST